MPVTKQLRKLSVARVCTLRIELEGIRPPIWRRFLVAEDITLARLHVVIQKVMGWTDSHLHEYLVAGDRFGVPDPEDPDTISETRIRLRQLLDRGIERFTYRYDFGDGWQHEIVIEHVSETEAGLSHPQCVAGERAAPPEDCGGVHGYEEFLETIFDPRHPEFSHMRSWAGVWQAEAFDLEAVNRQLQKTRRTPKGH
ncbi:MAG: plasmid pRiA4b ORF-3 family protein [Acidobacteriota bacterium]